MKTVVIYHAECADGFGASYAAWKKFGDEAIYTAAHHNTEPPAEIEGADVYTLDYAYKPDVIKLLLQKVSSLMIIDHHVTATGSVALVPKSVFDTNHSGAVLAWQFFHPNIPVPRLLQHIEDGDLWKFALPHTRELYEALMMQEFNYGKWDTLIQEVEDSQKFDTFVRDGELLLRRKEKSVAELLSHAEEIEFEGYKCKMVNSAMYSSLIGNELVKEGSPVAVIWSRRGKRIVVSLRSNGNPDVSVIAQKYGGGGHPAAAGFSWDEEDFLHFRK